MNKFIKKKSKWSAIVVNSCFTFLCTQSALSATAHQFILLNLTLKTIFPAIFRCKIEKLPQKNVKTRESERKVCQIFWIFFQTIFIYSLSWNAFYTRIATVSKKIKNKVSQIALQFSLQNSRYFYNVFPFHCRFFLVDFVRTSICILFRSVHN